MLRLGIVIDSAAEVPASILANPHVRMLPVKIRIDDRRYIDERRTHRTRWVNALAHAPVPVAYICGMADPISGAHMAARWRELVPQGSVVELPGVGHYPQCEAPAAVLAALESCRPPGD